MEMDRRQASAFITTRKGFCYLTVKCGRRNFHVMRIRNYTIVAYEKRHMAGCTRMLPSTGRKSPGNWPRSGKRAGATAPGGEPRHVFRASRIRLRRLWTRRTHSVCPSDEPSTIGETAALLDAVLHIDRTLKEASAPLPSPCWTSQRSETET